MSKKSDAAVPETAVNEAKHPTEKRIDGQMCDRVDSPVGDFPGCIYVVRTMSPAQFEQYWLRLHGASDDVAERRLYAADYYNRQHLVAEWHIEGVADGHLGNEHGQSLPAVELINFIVAATTPTVKRAMNLPNLPGWWPNITATPTSGGGKDEPTPES